ncbi:hypothetical protein RGU72_21045 [Undibacterium sp. 5I1]|uniref:hypothetical protein n=1 Tax=unclassified Undibacterium TaxID=2630295 RepID=UPI002AB4E0B6|nr:MULTISPECIES: hypothetical protein [unclassified Undibacterium]MDY7540735.1 hypothetical protein [Undibacterium sp. 5I1]MEB0232643.1 hypothetical protein [Undibacterium sp. 10I3]MEB0259628.1 hypothetical protein [Undibacterium sp. 5I1]
MSNKGQPYKQTFRADLLIEPLLKTIWSAGIESRGSCHGHLRDGKFSNPYISIFYSLESIKFIREIERYKFFLFLKWETIVCSDDGQRWTNLFAAMYKRDIRNKRVYRAALIWDVYVLSFIRCA